MTEEHLEYRPAEEIDQAGLPGEQPKKSKTRLLFKVLLSLGVVSMCLIALFLGGLYLYLTPKLPSVESLKDVQFQEPLRVFSADGKLIAEYGEMRRIPLDFEEIPQALKNAVIAVEDDRFWEHPGVDYRGLVRAGVNLLVTGKKSQGGSTITMQVARNFFLSFEKTYLRKLNEIFLALQIERELDKQQILALYLNKIYFGERAYGVGSAANIYYGVDVDQLNLSQMAMIAGLPKAPSKFNPIINPKRAIERRNHVLTRMRILGMISPDEYSQATLEPVTANKQETIIELEAPYVGEMARSFALERYGEDAYRAGLKVITTVDSRLQKAAVAALRDGLLNYEERHGYRGPIGRLENIKGLESLNFPDDLVLISVPVKRESLESAISSYISGLFGRENEDENASIRKSLDARLSQISPPGNLQAGVITAVEETSATVYLGGGEIRYLPWDGLSWARKYIDVDHQGDDPKRADEILAVGDIVWVRLKPEGYYALAQKPEVEGAIVALSPENGAIQSLVGGFDFFESKFNRATQAQRQPGSNFKPFIYAAALENGFTPASVFNDAPIVFDDPALEDQWKPKNYSGRFYGPTRLREGLFRSRNLVSVRLLLSLGISKARRYAAKFGFGQEALPRDLSLILGSGTLTPMDLVTGFSVFANGGYKIEPYIVDRIDNNDNQTIYYQDYRYVCEYCEEQAPLTDEMVALTSPLQAHTGPEQSVQAKPDDLLPENSSTVIFRQRKKIPAERVIDPRVAFLVNSMLHDVVNKPGGTGWRAKKALERNDLSGKTGTTSDFVDAWFSGFNRRLAVTSWVGFDALKPLGNGEQGARAALPIWINFMREALRDVPEEALSQPEGLTVIKIDPVTGLLANSTTPNAIFEIFKDEDVPTEESARVDLSIQELDSLNNDSVTEMTEQDIF